MRAAARIARRSLSALLAAALLAAPVPGQTQGASEQSFATLLDADCMARAIESCVTGAHPPPNRLPGQSLPDAGSEPCAEALTATEDGVVSRICDHNPAVHHNTQSVSACDAQLRAAPPAECRTRVLTERGIAELLDRFAQSQNAALREMLYRQCRALARGREDCDSLGAVPPRPAPR